MNYKDLTRSTYPWWQAKTPAQANETAKQIIEKVAEEVNPELAKKCKKAQQQVNQANSLSMESLGKAIAKQNQEQYNAQMYNDELEQLKKQSQWISSNDIKVDPNVPQNIIYTMPGNMVWSGTTTGGTIPATGNNPYWTGGNVPTPPVGPPPAYPGPDEYNEPNLPEPTSMADIYKPTNSKAKAIKEIADKLNKPSPIQQILNNGDAGDGKATQYYTQYKWKGNNVTAEEYYNLTEKEKQTNE